MRINKTPLTKREVLNRMLCYDQLYQYYVVDTTRGLGDHPEVVWESIRTTSAVIRIGKKDKEGTDHDKNND